VLTAAQITLYGRRWGAVCAANAWRMARGRLAPEARLGGSPAHEQVAALAERHARQMGRSVTVDDLRRACTAAAGGRFVSTYDLTNNQFTALLNLFALLMDPENLQAAIERDQPEIAQRRRYVAAIQRLAPEAYTLEVARDRFGGRFTPPHWEDLPIPALHQLAMTLRHRSPSAPQPSTLNRPPA
jgi:hypothetical protein